MTKQECKLILAEQPHYSRSFNHDYEVWGMFKHYESEPDVMQKLASFYFLQEALDYVYYCLRRDVSCVLRMRNTDHFDFKQYDTIK
jgi:hypothetical protein